MLNIVPCPYCKGEVEVVRLANKGKEKQYRIQCMKCHALVAKGTKFPIESTADGELRIKQYEEVLEEKFRRPIGSSFRWGESANYKSRKENAKHSPDTDNSILFKT